MSHRSECSLESVAAVLGVASQIGWDAVIVGGVNLDSGAVLPGDIFVARPGAIHHGADFADAAIAAGAVAVVTDGVGAGQLSTLAVPVLEVDDVAAAVGPLAAFVHGDPASQLTTIGVTGTNGKTTTTWLIESGWQSQGHSVGLIGTLGIHLWQQGRRDELPSTRTTPEATELHSLLATMCQRGIDHVTMEVSSHALSLGRVNGLVFDLAVFLNLTQDHLDFHRDLESYFAAKAELFEPAHARRALINMGDEWGQRLAASAIVPVVTFDVTGRADWTVTEIATSSAGMSSFIVHAPGGGNAAVTLDLPGRFQIENALAAIAALVETGADLAAAAAGVSACQGVPGRMQRIPASYLALVDYAHTPEAVARVLGAARELVPGRLLVVMGAGGDRDRGKREAMGLAASAAADLVVITDDNPRNEAPADIRAGLLRGARRGRAAVVEIADRRSAINEIVSRAEVGDAVLLLGKGAELGQERAGLVEPFDDRVELRAAIELVAGDRQ